MDSIISKKTKMIDAAELLRQHNINTPRGWEIVIGMLLADCDHLEVHGYGCEAYFTKVKEG